MSHEEDSMKNTDRFFPEVDIYFTTEKLYKVGLNGDLLKFLWEVGEGETRRERIIELFISGAFRKNSEAFCNKPKHRDYYAKHFLVHREAFSFRAAG